MDIEALKSQWSAQNSKLDELIRLNRQMISSPRKDGARSALRRLTAWTVVNAIGVWVGIPLMGIFMAHHHSSWKFILPAVALDVFMAVNLAMLIRQVLAIRSVDYNSPITAIQKQLENIRIMRLRHSRLVFMTMMLTWPPLSIVGAKALFDADLYVLAPGWLMINLLFALAMIPLTLWISRWMQRSRSPGVRQFLHYIGGQHLNAATQFIASIEEFERENTRKLD